MAAWHGDAQLMQALDSHDALERRHVLTLLRNHRAQLERFATRHTAFFFDAVQMMLERFDETDDVKRKAWSVLTTVVSLHSKTLTPYMLHEQRIVSLALETLRGAFGRDYGCSCVNDVLVFLLALKRDGVALAALDGGIVQCLAALPVRLGQGIDRFGYTQLLQLLRALQTAEANACSDTVDEHIVEMLDRVHPTMFLLVVEKVLEDCRAYFAAPAVCASVSSECSPENLATRSRWWPALSPVSLDALFTESVAVICASQCHDRRIAPFDSVVALKWLLENRSALSHQFVLAHNLAAELGAIASDTRSSHTVQRLAQELITFAQTRNGGNVMPDSSAVTAVVLDSLWTSHAHHDAIDWHSLAPALQQTLQALQSGIHGERRAAIASLMTACSAVGAATEPERRAVIATALRLLAGDASGLGDTTRAQLWTMLGAALAHSATTPVGTSTSCAHEYYELTCAALDAVVSARTSAVSVDMSDAMALLVGPLWSICVDEVAKNCASWRLKSAQATAAVMDVLATRLERTPELLKSHETLRAWFVLTQCVESVDKATLTEIPRLVERVCALVTRALDTSRGSRIALHALYLARALTRSHVAPPQARLSWIQSAFQSVVAVEHASNSSRGLVFECLEEISQGDSACQSAVDATAPSLAKDAAAMGCTTLAFVAELLACTTSPRLSASRIAHVLFAGTSFEVYVVLKHLADGSADEIKRDVVASGSGLAVLAQLCRQGEASHRELAKRVLAQSGQTDFQRRVLIVESQLTASSADQVLSQERMEELCGCVPALLVALARELAAAVTQSEARDVLLRRIPTLVQLIERERLLSSSAFLECMAWVFHPSIHARLWASDGAVSVAADCDALTQTVLHALEVDGAFVHRAQVLAFLRAVARAQNDARSLTLVAAMPLFVQRLSEENSNDVASELVSLVREVAQNRLDVWDAIDCAIQRVVDDATGSDADNSVSFHYQNLLAIYRPASGIKVGASATSSSETLEATAEVLTTGTRVEKFLALSYMRTAVQRLRFDEDHPPVLSDSVRVIVGLTLQGPESVRVLASDLLAHLATRDNEVADAVAQIEASAPSGISASQRHNRSRDRASSRLGAGVGDAITRDHVYLYDDSDDASDDDSAVVDVFDTDQSIGQTKFSEDAMANPSLAPIS